VSAEVETYSNDLLLALRVRDVPGARIAEAIAEVQSYVSDTGEQALDAFGPVEAYADELVAALGVAGAPGRDTPAWTAARYGLGGFVGSQLLLSGVLARLSGDTAWLGLPAEVAMGLGFAVLVVTAVALTRLTRSSDDPVLDPRTGADLCPPLPRWVLPLMLLPPALALVLAAVVGLVRL